MYAIRSYYDIRSSLVAIISLPVGILSAFGIMHLQGINANIMSLGGIAIAIGTMVDAAIVMIENVHKHMEREPLTDSTRWRVWSAGYDASHLRPVVVWPRTTHAIAILAIVVAAFTSGYRNNFV